MKRNGARIYEPVNALLRHKQASFNDVAAVQNRFAYIEG